ncbi:hypothetical protein LQ567_15915 [Niabella pedocola]|uniref:Uncharacterized protein n=1 Tax=Niabella pedocola TaxID=1752077 RepID=A0ABS8PT83_9BACT|nr:hypothetical protein [Niabella pedocola]MCD2424267.1 hypothetical protein [Niabella pedocola]
MKKGIFFTIGVFALLTGFFSLSAFTKAEKSVVPATAIGWQKQTILEKINYTTFWESSFLNNLKSITADTDCSETTWTSGLTMNVIYNAVTQYNSFSMNFSGTGPYVLEYSIWANGPNYGYMGSGTIHNFQRNYYYMFPVSLPPGDYAIDYIIKNECGEDLSDPQEFLFTNENEIE